MTRAIVVLLIAVIATACGSSGPTPSPLRGELPKTVGGQPITYTETAASQTGDHLVHFEQPIEAVGGDIATADVAIGTGQDGFTLTAVRVPGVDARRLVDPLIAAADLRETARQTLVVGGHNVVVLTLPPTSSDRAYLYAFGETAVILTTSQSAFADEVIGSLP